MFEIILISIALAMDCFSVSIAAGVTARRVVLRPMMLMVLAFGLFQGGMTLLGYLGMAWFSGWIESIDHWIAFGLLSYIGFNMIKSLWHKDDDNNIDLLDTKCIPMLAIATSIDALAVGISFACVGFGSLAAYTQWPGTLACLIIGLGSSLFTVLGLSIGITAGKRITFPVEPIGGLVLIAIGIKILIEHIGQ